MDIFCPFFTSKTHRQRIFLLQIGMDKPAVCVLKYLSLNNNMEIEYEKNQQII